MGLTSWQDVDDDLVTTASLFCSLVEKTFSSGNRLQAFHLSKNLSKLVEACLQMFQSSSSTVFLDCLLAIGFVQVKAGNVMDAYQTLLSVLNTWLPVNEQHYIGLHSHVVHLTRYVSEATFNDLHNDQVTICLKEIVYTIVLLTWDVYPMVSEALSLCLEAFLLFHCCFSKAVSIGCIGNILATSGKTLSSFQETWLNRLLFILNNNRKGFTSSHAGKAIECLFQKLICPWMT